MKYFDFYSLLFTLGFILSHLLHKMDLGLCYDTDNHKIVHYFLLWIVLSCSALFWGILVSTR